MGRQSRRKKELHRAREARQQQEQARRTAEPLRVVNGPQLSPASTVMSGPNWQPPVEDDQGDDFDHLGLDDEDEDEDENLPSIHDEWRDATESDDELAMPEEEAHKILAAAGCTLWQVHKRYKEGCMEYVEWDYPESMTNEERKQLLARIYRKKSATPDDKPNPPCN